MKIKFFAEESEHFSGVAEFCGSHSCFEFELCGEFVSGAVPERFGDIRNGHIAAEEECAGRGDTAACTVSIGRHADDLRKFLAEVFISPSAASGNRNRAMRMLFS